MKQKIEFRFDKNRENYVIELLLKDDNPLLFIKMKIQIQDFLRTTNSKWFRQGYHEYEWILYEFWGEMSEENKEKIRIFVKSIGREYKEYEMKWELDE